MKELLQLLETINLAERIISIDDMPYTAWTDVGHLKGDIMWLWADGNFWKKIVFNEEYTHYDWVAENSELGRAISNAYRFWYGRYSKGQKIVTVITNDLSYSRSIIPLALKRCLLSKFEPDQILLNSNDKFIEV